MPVSGAPLAVTPTPYVIPTSSFNDANGTNPVTSGPPIALTIILVCVCGVMLLLILVIILGVVLRSQNQKAGKNG